MKRLAPLVAALALLASCATAPQTADDVAILEFLSALDSADAESAVALSAPPFVYDEEVLLRESDLEVLWRGLKDARFTFGTARVISVAPVGRPEDLGGTFLLAGFGRKIDSEPVSIVRVETVSGEYTVLLEGRRFGRYALRGMRGMR